MQELPRFSGTLRALLGDASPVDLVHVRESRKRRLHQIRKNAELQAMQVDTGVALTWQSFTGELKGLPGRTPKEDREMRRAYNSFTSTLSSLLGEEVAPKHLAQMAHSVFHALADEQDGGAARAALLLQAKEIEVAPLLPLVHKLARWRRRLLGEPEDPVVDSGVEESKNKKKNTRGFGGSVAYSFQAPESLMRKPAPRPSLQKSEVVRAKKPRKPEQKPAASSILDWLRNATPMHESVAAVVQSANSEQMLQAQLFDLLGVEQLDLLGQVIEKSVELKHALVTPVSSSAPPVAVLPSFPEGDRKAGSVTITMEGDKERRKQLKREKRAAARAAAARGGGTESIREAREAEKARLAAALQAGEVAEVKESNYVAGGSTDSSGFGKFRPPPGAKKHNEKDWESMWLPAKERPLLKEQDFLPIQDAYEEWALPAFKGYKTLNRIQSIVHGKSYGSNENLLICAPTGAGKTNIAMGCVLREIGKHIEEGFIHKEDFKIVYVAPMKALAAEMTAGFGKRLKALGIIVRELTGDMQLTKREIEETQMIVTTPEKFDVVTRKSSDSPLVSLVRLLIIDEVHLLNEERGPVIETIVARTLRQVETTQSMIRIVGLSATLPNYKDVAQFLSVNEKTGLFYFDDAYRPVPLEQTFVGVKGNANAQRALQDELAYKYALASIKNGHQCMIFGHSRKGTTKTAEAIIRIASEKGGLSEFGQGLVDESWAKKDLSRAQSSELRSVSGHGFGIHHAGMSRSDRNLVEKMFSRGVIKVLCCTATLAWGVNLPAHTVIIKGTQVYNSDKGKFMSLGMLDVMQIFGRAGRPQFDKSGEAIMITSHDELYRYLALTTKQLPIESQLIANLANALNAEIVLGTVTNVNEAVRWLSYTYLFVRMQRNPMAYGISRHEKMLDPELVQKRIELIENAGVVLDDCRMERFDKATGNLNPTSLGRIASHYYIRHETIQTFNETFEKQSGPKNNINLGQVFKLIASASEFENMQTREEELQELDSLKRTAPIEIKGDAAGDASVKVNILLQAFISQTFIKKFSLVCDANYVAQNGGRIARGLFEIALRNVWPDAASLLLSVCKMIDLRMWDTGHPLRQFKHIKLHVIRKLESLRLTVDRLLDMDSGELSALTRVPAASDSILRAVRQIPYIEVDTQVQPITRTIIRVKLTLTPMFTWVDRVHHNVQPFWLWVVDPEERSIMHHEYFMLHKNKMREPMEIVFTVPISHPAPPQYILHMCSDRWLGGDETYELSFKHLIVPELYPPHTELLKLQPLPVSVLKNEAFERVFKYSHFNPIQTQAFHVLYHTDQNVLLGAPTGSGKTVAAELACLRVFRETPRLKVVYLGPLKALVRERLKDWKPKFVENLGKSMVELTGEFTPDMQALKRSDIIITTPEKWDGISRSWKNRSYVKQVGLVIIDEIHLLGEDRGPILEVIVSRMRFISTQTDTPIRILGLSTALANAQDLGHWLGIEGPGLFNFHPSVRPVPLQIHVQGFEGKHYCPRMAKMNKPVYSAIVSYSPRKPVLVFVSSRRQTRLTALDVIALVAADGDPKRFVWCENQVLEDALAQVRDSNLKHVLSFGIGLHHAGLPRGDRDIVERLFASNAIQVLISTATLAWGVNLPAFCVIIKGGEYFDPKTSRYVDYAITDMLQMMGRAGRPQFDDRGEAVIMVKTSMKGFYTRFLYEPFPVESSLMEVLHDHLNAEIVSGTVGSKSEAVEYLTWTYLYRRITMNPTYYGLEDASQDCVNEFLSDLVDDVLQDLEDSGCLEIDEEDSATLHPLRMGQLASYYYLSHRTARVFLERVDADQSIEELLQTVSEAAEFDELPVRHNEDKINEELSENDGIRYELQHMDFEDPHVKANLLLQAHFSRLQMPINDYIGDTHSVLGQSIRVLQALIDTAADGGFLWTTLRSITLMQMVVQATWPDHSTMLQLRKRFRDPKASTLAQLVEQRAPGTQHLPVVDIKVQRTGNQVTARVKRRGPPPNRIHAPLFPKQKNEAWFCLLGIPEAGELLALQRVTLRGNGWQSVTLTVPDEEEDEDPLPEGDWWVYLIPDCYLGLDRLAKVTE